MGKRVLVGYATRNGSTVGVAEAIASELGEMGWSADTRPMKDGPGLEGYDAVVLGSAINGGAWLAEAMSFLEDNREELAAVPVAVFCVHAMNTKDTPKAEVRRKAYLDKVRALVDPAAEGYFAGVGPLAEDTSAFARWAFKAFGGDVVGDGRDWDEIRAWARGLAL